MSQTEIEIPKKASEKETEYIRNFQKLIDENKDTDPILISENNTSTFYYPIVTNDMCLTCHGTPEKFFAVIMLNIAVQCRYCFFHNNDLTHQHKNPNKGIQAGKRKN